MYIWIQSRLVLGHENYDRNGIIEQVFTLRINFYMVIYCRDFVRVTFNAKFVDKMMRFMTNFLIFFWKNLTFTFEN
jgi:hypothetical protein